MYDELHFLLRFQLIGEAKISKQEGNELKQKMTFINTEMLADQPINDSENHTEMENCSAILGQEITDDDSVEQDMKSDSENGTNLERIENHQTEQIPLKSERTQFGSKIGTHPQEVPVMTEVYQGNDMMPCRKLMAEENCQLKKEDHVFNVDDNLNCETETVNIYRWRIKVLEQELERTIDYFQIQVKWAARFAERKLFDLKKEYKRKRSLT
ncbi:cTAGE family member 2-like [Ochotona curzoniae]|uniref:cTAGE family member 2-like n=1 Tax=Ochotona curzoniae TaxID=130825 RepID=UPI001B34E569|nr:cTAGE family member 2-like [Ochotona curzoniae]